MNYAEPVQVPRAQDQLKNYVLGPFFTKAVISLRQVLKKVAATDVFQHEVVVVWRFKNVDQRYDVLVLTHFQNFDLSLLL